MKKLLINIVCAFCIAFSVLAVEDTVTVRASVEATMANSRAKNECIIKAKKLAVEKYLGSLDSGMAETLVKRAVQDYKKYIDEVEADEGDDGTASVVCDSEQASLQPKLSFQPHSEVTVAVRGVERFQGGVC